MSRNGNPALPASSRTTPCDLCQGDEFAVLSRTDRRRSPLNTVLCRQCGLVSHERIPTDDELQRYYADDYRQEYHGEYHPSPHRIIRAWDGGQWLMRQLLPHVPAGSRVFEIGAGIGCTVKSFELAGFDSSGIEPGRGFEQFGRDVLHARLECKQLEDLPLKPAYDFILLVHVIEHLASPSQALGRIRQMLRPGGRLYVECPNVEGPHAAPAKLFHYAHIYNFTHATLKMLAETTGFRVVACLTKPHHRTVRYVLERWDHSCPAPAMSAEAGARTVQAIHRYSSLTYYLRPSYLAERLWRDLRFSAHHFASRWRLARLIQRCQADATSLEKRVEMLSVASSVRS